MKGKMFVDRTNSRMHKFFRRFLQKKFIVHLLILKKKKMNIRLIIDNSSVEIFINNGELSFTSIFFPSEEFNTISVLANNGTCNIINAEIHPLKSIWSKKEEDN